MYTESELDSLLNNQSPQWNYMLDYLSGIDITPGPRGAEAYAETFLLPKNSTITRRTFATAKSGSKGSSHA